MIYIGMRAFYELQICRLSFLLYVYIYVHPCNRYIYVVIIIITDFQISCVKCHPHHSLQHLSVLIILVGAFYGGTFHTCCMSISYMYSIVYILINNQLTRVTTLLPVHTYVRVTILLPVHTYATSFAILLPPNAPNCRATQVAMCMYFREKLLIGTHILYLYDVCK